MVATIKETGEQKLRFRRFPDRRILSDWDPQTFSGYGDNTSKWIILPGVENRRASFGKSRQISRSHRRATIGCGANRWPYWRSRRGARIDGRSPENLATNDLTPPIRSGRPQPELPRGGVFSPLPLISIRTPSSRRQPLAQRRHRAIAELIPGDPGSI